MTALRSRWLPFGKDEFQFDIILGKDWICLLDVNIDPGAGVLRLLHSVVACDMRPPEFRRKGVAVLAK